MPSYWLRSCIFDRRQISADCTYESFPDGDYLKYRTVKPEITSLEESGGKFYLGTPSQSRFNGSDDWSHYWRFLIRISGRVRATHSKL